MEAHAKQFLQSLYGSVLDMDKFMDSKQLYMHHVETSELHGIFLNPMAMSQLKRGIKGLLEIGDQYAKLIEDTAGPFSFENHRKLLRYWHDKGVLLEAGVRHDKTTKQELNAAQHVLVVGGGFIPAYASYALGSSILEMFNMVNQTFAMFTEMTGLEINKWDGQHEKLAADAKVVKSALHDLVTLVVGYDAMIRNKYTTLANLLPEVRREQAAEFVAILGDCNPEFWLTLRELGKRKCCLVHVA